MKTKDLQLQILKAIHQSEEHFSEPADDLFIRSRVECAHDDLGPALLSCQSEKLIYYSVRGYRLTSDGRTALKQGGEA